MNVSGGGFLPILVTVCNLYTAHRQSGETQRPAAAAGGRKAAPGAGAPQGVGGTARPREGLCEARLDREHVPSVRDALKTSSSSALCVLSAAAEGSRGVTEDVRVDEAARGPPQTAGWPPHTSSSNSSGCSKVQFHNTNMAVVCAFLAVAVHREV